MIVITSESNENYLYENHINISDAMSFITYNYNFTIYPTNRPQVLFLPIKLVFCVHRALILREKCDCYLYLPTNICHMIALSAWGNLSFV